MNKNDNLSLETLTERVRVLESVIMNLLKNKSTKDLSKIFSMSEQQVRETKAICSDI